MLYNKEKNENAVKYNTKIVTFLPDHGRCALVVAVADVLGCCALVFVFPKNIAFWTENILYYTCTMFASSPSLAGKIQVFPLKVSWLVGLTGWWMFVSGGINSYL